MYSYHELITKILPLFLRTSGAEFVRRSQAEPERAFIMHEGGAVVHVPLDELAKYEGEAVRAEVKTYLAQQITPLVVIGIDKKAVLPINPADVDVFSQAHAERI
jgi:hypothetical protein